MLPASQETRSSASAKHGGWHAHVLWFLLAVFLFRVLAQLVVAFVSVGFLPTFEAWHSATLPYPALVTSQVAIVALFVWLARDIGRLRPTRPALGRFLVIFGTLYFTLMSIRLVLGATLWKGSSWVDAPIPSTFHLVLAGFLIVAGHYHSIGGNVRRLP